MTDTVSIGDRFHPTDDLPSVYTVTAVSRFGHPITHATLTSDASDRLAVTVGIGELFDVTEWVPAR